jgi:hypothetical protein|tara:strand:+ start:11716 stop:11973 length:258 start_codon:yes stop_codon:yes gene_type:complete
MRKKEVEEALNLPMTKEQFICQVETLVRRDEMGYAEAIIYICEEREFDPEDITTFISGPLKEKLKLEAVNNNVLKTKKSNTAKLV